MTMKLYRLLAQKVDAYHRCAARPATYGNMAQRHKERLQQILDNHLPHGSGFDNGIKLEFDDSTGEKLVFTVDFHHMNDGGYYEGWTKHVVTVRPSLMHGFVTVISGRNRNEIKDYLADAFKVALDSELDEWTLQPMTRQDKKD